MRATLRVECADAIADVSAYGWYGDAELIRDLFIRAPLPDSSDDVALALGEAVDRTYGIACPCSLPSSSATGTLEK